MSIEIQAHTGNMKIESYNLAEFLTEIQEGILQGFRLDLTTNANYPYGSGSYYSTILVPESQEKEEKIEGTEEAWESRQLGASAENVEVADEKALVELKQALDSQPTPTRGRKPSKK